MNELSVRGELLGRFMEIWNRYFVQFSQSGLAPFLDRYYAQWLHTNQRVNVLRDDNSTTSVIIKGINEHGFLLGVDTEGNCLELIPDGNTFNFLEGLISKKTFHLCFKEKYVCISCSHLMEPILKYTITHI